MITKHAEKTLTLHDGERDHTIKYDAFAPMKPHDKGGVHPSVTEEYHGWLAIDPRMDMATCPVKPVTIEHDDPLREGKKVTVTYLPIPAYLQAHYGPDKQIVTVPINGDANAERLHWLHRTKKERTEMKAVLEWLGAWRLTDDGEIPEKAA